MRSMESVNCVTANKTAVFLAKVAPPKLAAVIRTAVQLLAGIPSVVYGLCLLYTSPSPRD